MINTQIFNKNKLKLIVFGIVLVISFIFLTGCKKKEYVTISFLRDANHRCRLDGVITKRVEKGKPIGNQVKPPKIIYNKGYKQGDNLWQPAFDSNAIVTNDLIFTATTQIDTIVNDFLYEVRYLKRDGINNFVPLIDSDKYYGYVGQRRSIDILQIPGYKTEQPLSLDIEFTSQIKQGYDVIFTIDETQKFNYEIQYLEDGTSNKIKPSFLGKDNVEKVIPFTPKSTDVQGFDPISTETVKLVLTNNETTNVIKNYYKRNNNAWTTISFETDHEHHSSFASGSKTTFNVLKDVPFSQQNITPPIIIYAQGYQQGLTIWDNNFSSELSVNSHKIFRAVVVKDNSQWMQLAFTKTTGIESLNGTLHFEVLRNVPLIKQKVVEPEITYKVGFKRGTTKWIPLHFSINNAYDQESLVVKPNVQEVEKIRLTFNADTYSTINNMNSVDIFVYKDIPLVLQNFQEPVVIYKSGYKVSSLGKWDKSIYDSYSSNTTFNALTEKDLIQWTKVSFKNDKYNIVSLSGKIEYDVIKNVPLTNQSVFYPTHADYKGISTKWSISDLNLLIQDELIIELIVSVVEEEFNFDESFEASFIAGQGYIITKAKPIVSNYVGLALPKFYNSQRVIGLSDEALTDLQQLKLFKISNKMTTLSGKCFYKNPYFIIEDYEESDEKKFRLQDDILYSFDLSILIMCPSLISRSEIVISNTCIKILEKAFINLENSNKITIPSNIITFEINAITVPDPLLSELKLYLSSQVNLAMFISGWTNVLDKNIILELE